MATISDISNKGASGVGVILGTNSKKSILKKLTSARALWLFKPSFSFPSGSTFNLAAVQEAQAAGNLVVLQGVNTFEENGDDDNIETLDDTTKEVTNRGKYAFTATFTNGLDFNAALASVQGFGQYNVGIVTATGDIIGASDASEGLTGFDTGMLKQDKLQFGTTSAGQKEGISFQFLDRDEVDSEFVFIDRQNLDFNPLKVEGINQVVCSYVNTPANTDTTITIKLTLQDRVTPVSGVPFGDFNRIVAGSTSNPTAGDDSATPGSYVLTVSPVSTGDAESISLYDNSQNRGIISLSGDLYQSNTATATATA